MAGPMIATIVAVAVLGIVAFIYAKARA